VALIGFVTITRFKMEAQFFYPLQDDKSIAVEFSVEVE
jgi:hypothetical protein